MEDNLKTEISKLILDYYTMYVKTDVKKFNKHYIIKITIEFTPKNFDDAFTPKKCKYVGTWSWYSEINKISYDNASYIIEDEMPLLKYFGSAGRYWFIEFYENLAKETFEQTIMSLKIS